MTTTAPAPPAGARRDTASAGGTDSFNRVARSEWTKLWSLRSTMWTLLALLVVTVGFSTLASWGTASNLERAGRIDPTGIALAGILFGQLAIAVLGVLVISGEYSTGGIKASLTAVPQRIRFLLAKALVFAVVALVIGLITCFVSFYVGMIFFDAKHVGVGLGDPHVLRAVIGGGLYIAASGLLGYAIGLILRHTAGAISIIVALLFVAPIVLSAIPAHIVQTVNKYFLGSAGVRITEVLPAPNALGPWIGYLVFTLEWVALFVVGAGLMKRRDA